MCGFIQIILLYKNGGVLIMKFEIWLWFSRKIMNCFVAGFSFSVIETPCYTLPLTLLGGYINKCSFRIKTQYRLCFAAAYEHILCCQTIFQGKNKPNILLFSVRRICSNYYLSTPTQVVICFFVLF